MALSADELRAEIHSIFNPEPVVGSEGPEWHETPPLPRLEYSLDTTYWREFEYGSISPLMRRAVTHDEQLAAIVHAQQVPRELFFGALRLLADSIMEYHGELTYLGGVSFLQASNASQRCKLSRILLRNAPEVFIIFRPRLLSGLCWCC